MRQVMSCQSGTASNSARLSYDLISNELRLEYGKRYVRQYLLQRRRLAESSTRRIDFNVETRSGFNIFMSLLQLCLKAHTLEQFRFGSLLHIWKRWTAEKKRASARVRKNMAKRNDQGKNRVSSKRTFCRTECSATPLKLES